jgi:hypothetical protein
MKHITITDAQGAINRTVSCPAEMVAHQIQPGEYYVDGTYNYDTHYLDTATGAMQLKPVRPLGDVYFDMASKSWLPTVYTTAQLIASAMGKRAQLLAVCDWTQLPDVPIATRTAWAAYRQALRDMTLQAGYPQNIIWPVSPV